MDREFLKRMKETDRVADGCFCCSDSWDLPDIDVRKAARLGEELGLKPGEFLPDEYLEQCRFYKREQ